MTKLFHIIHRWYGNSECDWIPWLREELKRRGLNSIAYDMPDTNRPKMQDWVSFISAAVANPDEGTYFVGHSIGCQAIIRYIADLPDGVVVGGAVLVAPWVQVVNLESDEKPIAKPWSETPIDWEKAKQHSKRFTIIYSNNDKWVTESEAKTIGEMLGAKMVLDRHKGHFTEEDGVTQLPSLLEGSVSICRT